uniref:Uncharacterized protein n=1 Tax=Aegilops tauschii subsp. strangulata TaxID=200361 RepID=A0A453SRA4_AEGTS
GASMPYAQYQTSKYLTWKGTPQRHGLTAIHVPLRVRQAASTLDNLENKSTGSCCAPSPRQDIRWFLSFHERLGTGGQLAHDKGTKNKHIYLLNAQFP